MSTSLSRGVKVEQSTWLINKYEINMQGYLKIGTNFGRFESSETLASLVKTEVELWLVTAWNKNENSPKRYQTGGTGLVAINALIEYYKNLRTNFQYLGQWCSYIL